MSKPAVFLDRDGTLNVQVIRDGRPYPPSGIADFALYPGVAESCRLLKSAGFALIVATNQPDVGRGTQRRDVVEAMHDQLLQWIPEIDRIEVCYEPGGEAESYRRKPGPGMILEAAETCGIDLSRSWMIGDRWRDIDCGKRAGVRTVFIDWGYAETLHAPPDFTVSNFAEAARIILSRPLSQSISES